jgi:hypothetical protein
VEGREGAGGFIRTHGGIDCNRRWLSGSLPAEKKVAVSLYSGRPASSRRFFRIDTAARYSLLLGSSKISRLKLLLWNWLIPLFPTTLISNER